jgi:hypothetical protein
VQLYVKSIKRSAHRHGIGDERIRYVVVNARRVFDVPAHPTIEGVMVLFLGPDPRGVPLEVMARQDDTGGLTIFHANRMSAAYERFYRDQGY